MNQYQLSVVIPTYNSIAKMDETIRSLDDAAELMDLEVVIVDDGSKDSTFNALSELSEKRPHWTVHQLEENSGSAAKPRNQGIELARGKYIFFLDSDDVLSPQGLANALSTAQKYNYEIVRSSIDVRMGNGESRIGDLIPGWDRISDPVERKRAITRHQSLTCSFLMLRSLLNDHGIRFDELRRIGEDIKFTAEVLLHSNKIGYRSVPARTYVRNAVGEESVTQKINSTQFHDFIKSWNDVEETLADQGISFIHEHGHSAIQYALRQFVWFKTEKLDEAVFGEFANFCNRHRADVRRFKFPGRYRELIDAALENDYVKFNEAVKLRLLVTGHDLKFMKEILEFAEVDYALKIDKWENHTEHDDQQSNELLNWADIIWAEWLLGAAAWYSNRVRGDQRLIIRAHRSELTAKWGEQLKIKNVAAIVTIAPHILNDFADRFDIPRSKLWLIPNALDVEAYNRGEYSDSRRKRFAMVGVLPKLKGYKRGIEVLASLTEEFPDAELWVYGKQPQELEWMMRDEEQANYYKECDELAAELMVTEKIKWQGWVDTKEALSEVGVVASFSDFEGMQVSVAEGFCSGGLGMTLNWRGASEGYPRKFVFDSSDEIRDAIASVMRGDIDLEGESRAARELITELYDVKNVWDKVEAMIKSIRA